MPKRCILGPSTRERGPAIASYITQHDKKTCQFKMAHDTTTYIVKSQIYARRQNALIFIIICTL